MSVLCANPGYYLVSYHKTRDKAVFGHLMWPPTPVKINPVQLLAAEKCWAIHSNVELYSELVAFFVAFTKATNSVNDASDSSHCCMYLYGKSCVVSPQVICCKISPQRDL